MLYFFFSMIRPLPRSTLFPYTTLFRSVRYPKNCVSEVYLVLLHRHEFLVDPKTGFRDDANDIPQIRKPVLGSTRNRSEEHTSELQSHSDLVCRLLLEKKKD